MKKMIIVLIALSLVAGTAFAADGGPFRSIAKQPPTKQAGTPDKGTLDCSGAIEITLDNIYYGDNTGLPDNVSMYGCSTWDESGGEVVYHLYLDTPAMFEGTLTGSGCDLDLAVLDQCDEDLGCLIVVDAGVVTNVPVSGDFYFVVDGFGGAGCPFTFEINTVTPVEPDPYCSAVEDVYGTHFTGDTCGGINNFSSLDCGDFAEDGLEAYYEILLPAGSSFTADVTYAVADGALWLLDSCTGPFNCLAYADNTLDGETETLAYANDSGSDMVVYLVVDSWGADSCGTYTLDFASTGGAVPTVNRSFSDVKATYR